MNSPEAIKAPLDGAAQDHRPDRRQHRGAGRRPDAVVRRQGGAADHALPAGPGRVPAGLGGAAAGHRGRGRRQDADDAAAAYQTAVEDCAGGKDKVQQLAGRPLTVRRATGAGASSRNSDVAGLGSARALGFVAARPAPDRRLPGLPRALDDLHRPHRLPVDRRRGRRPQFVGMQNYTRRSTTRSSTTRCG